MAKAIGVSVRAALRDLSAEVTARRLSLVVAPGGSGKTTLLACWRRELEGRGERCAWLDLDPAHGDPAVFLEELVRAVRETAAPEASDFGAALLRDLPYLDREDTRALARRCRAAAADLGRGVTLFLDNYHLLERDGPTDRLLDRWLRDDTPLHFAIATRGARPRCAPRLLAASDAMEVTESDLSLRGDQVTAALEARGVAARALVPLLLAETRGWATGVQLAAQALERLPESEREAFTRSLARRDDLFDYVAGEVIAGESTERVELLEVAAVLGPAQEDALVSALPRHALAEQIGPALDRGLLLRRDGRVGVHHLWEAFLARLLRQRLPDADWRALHARLARFADDPARAVQICGRGEAWPELAAVLEEHGRTWVDRGRYRFVEEWLDRLPGDLRGSARLAHLSAIVAARREPDAAIAELEKVAARYRETGDSKAESTALLDAWVVATNENRTGRMPTLLRRMLSLRRLVTDPTARALSIVAGAVLANAAHRHRLALRLLRSVRTEALEGAPRASVAMGLSIIGRYADWDATLALLDDAVADARYREHAPSFFYFQATRALLRGLRGIEPERCLREAEEAAQSFQEFGLSASEVACRDALGKLHAREGRHAEARAAFERAIVLVERTGLRDYESGLRGQLACQLWLQRQPEAAREEALRAIEAFEGSLADRSYIPARFHVAVSLRVLAECGEAERAHALAQRHARVFRTRDLPIAHHQSRLLLARVAELAGDGSAAERLLREAAELRVRHALRDWGTEIDPRLEAWTRERSAAPRWRIESLGGIRVERDGRLLPESAWRGALQRRLLLRLLVSRGPERREVLETELWPDAEPRRARGNLRVALSRLRGALGAEALVADGERVGVVPELREGWDVQRFRELTASENGAVGALDLYRGAFAPELYDDWAEDARRELEGSLLSLVRRHVESGLDQGNGEAARAVAARLTELLPAEEESWALRVRTEIEAGDPDGARRTLERARARLERETGSTGGPALDGLASRLGL